MIEENQRVELKKTFTAKDVETYFLLTGDSNPRYTEKTIGGRQIVPTGLLMGLISSILGTKLPGRGTNWLKQKLFFPEAAFTGEEITTIMEVTSVRPEKKLVYLHAECTTGNGKTVCTGESLVLVQDPASPAQE